MPEPTREAILASYAMFDLTPGATSLRDLTLAMRTKLKDVYGGGHNGVDDRALPLNLARDIVEGHIKNGSPSLAPPQPIRPDLGGAPGVRIVETGTTRATRVGGRIIIVNVTPPRGRGLG